MFEEGVFAIPGADGQPVRCEVLFTYDCEANGRSYVVYTFGPEEGRQIGANRYVTNEAGETQLSFRFSYTAVNGFFVHETASFSIVMMGGDRSDRTTPHAENVCLRG